MTNKDCLKMIDGLNAVKQPSFADIREMQNKDEYMFHAKFLQVVSLNKRKLENIHESLKDMDKSSEEYIEYWKKREEVLVKFSKKDAEGNPIITTSYENGSQQKSYTIPGFLDKNSEVSKEIKKLEDKYKDAIDGRKKQTEEVNKVLNEETEFKPVTVPWSMIPRGLSPEAMDGVIYMIEEEKAEVDEEVDKKETTKKSKH